MKRNEFPAMHSQICTDKVRKVGAPSGSEIGDRRDFSLLILCFFKSCSNMDYVVIFTMFLTAQ